MDTADKNLNVQARASVFYIFSNLLSKGFVFIFTPIFARILSAEALGIYSLYVSWLGIFTVISTLEMHGNITYRALLTFDSDESFLSTAFISVGSISSVLLFIYILFRDSFNAITGLTTPLTVIMLLQIFLNASEGFIFAKKRFSYNYKWVCTLNIIMGIITPILSIILIYFFDLSYLSRILSPLFVSVAFILPHTLHFLGKGRIFNKKIYRHLFALSIPMLPHFIFLSLMANGDKIIISHILGSEAVGTYSIAYSVAYILMPLTQGASSSLFPWLTRHSGKECKSDVKVAFDYILPFSMLLAGAFLLITPELYLFVGGEKFKDGLASVYPLSLSVIFLFLSNLISSVNACHKKRYVVISTLISFLVGASCVLPLVNALGIIGGAIASLLAYITLFSLNLYFSYKSLGFLMINRGTLIVTLLLIGIYAPISFISRTSLPLRIILLVILIIGALYILKGKKKNFRRLKKS